MDAELDAVAVERIANIRGHHVEVVYHADDVPECYGCGQNWPCDADMLKTALDAATERERALRAKLAAITEAHWRDHDEDCTCLVARALATPLEAPDADPR